MSLFIDCRLGKLLLGLASTVLVPSLGTHDHILLSGDWEPQEVTNLTTLSETQATQRPMIDDSN
jgi:hypothetical protein